MSELVETLRPEFQDKEYRHAYAEECLNAMIAAQIKVLREQRGMTQKQLADGAGMGQPRIPLLEDSSYENWSVNTLKRLAKAFDVALSVKFDTFSRVIEDFATMNRESLKRPTFANDHLFQSKRVPFRRGRNKRSNVQSRSRRVVRFRRYLSLATDEGMAGSSNEETNQVAAKKKEPARVEKLANGPLMIGGQEGLGETYA